MVNGLSELPADIDDAALRLGVLDDEDLAVVSAHLQDADVLASDIVYLPPQLRFVMMAARFDWPLAIKGQFWRRTAGLHFERVLKVARNARFGEEPGKTHRLLAIAFEVGDAPSGTVLLTFAGGAQIRLEVECLEAGMRDVGPRWAVDHRPDHPETPAAPGAPRPKSPA